MTEAKNGNSTWARVLIAIMGAITLFSTGWAASTTTAWMDVKRIDTQGTQKTQQLETRVTKIETTMEVCLNEIRKQLERIDQTLQQRQGKLP